MSTSCWASSTLAAVQSAPAVVRWSAENDVVKPRQRQPAALAAVTLETASSITSHEDGSKLWLRGQNARVFDLVWVDQFAAASSASNSVSQDANSA